MHWRNSSFQVAHFLVGKCHTPDEAYRVLCELREERQLAINNVKATSLRTEAKVLRANEKVYELSSKASAADLLEAQADLADVEAFRESNQACIDEAQRELKFIDTLIDKIQPHRVYKGLPDHEAHQMCQQEEWKQELIWRAQNYIGSQGAIPADQLATMRLHPEWVKSISPAIKQMVHATNKGIDWSGTFQRPMEQIMLEFEIK